MNITMNVISFVSAPSFESGGKISIPRLRSARDDVILFRKIVVEMPAILAFTCL